MSDDISEGFSLGAAQDFIDNAPCGFLSFNDNGTILLVNNFLLDLLGYSREELERLHVDRLLTVAGRIFYQTHFFPLLKLRSRVEEIYLSLRTKQGSEIPMMVNASRLNEGAQYVNHCVLLTMHERRKFEDELIAARKAVEETAKAKDEFVAMVSHELRTPLTAITGWLHILQEGASDPETVRESIEVIERNAVMQRQLIEDLLDFSRITAGKLRLDVGHVDLHEVVRNALDVVRPAADAKGIRLSSVLDPNAGPVMGDANRLQQVIWNLLSNAVKFTPKQGRILIQLRRANSHAEILVSDSGIGIDAEFLPYVFERFRQEDNSRTRRYGGLGLGLAITKEIIELHGGTIAARSEGSGRGSIFELHLPIPSVQSLPANSQDLSKMVAAQLERDPITETVLEHQPQLSGLRILIVDDIRESLDMIARILRKAGATVEIAEGARIALDLLATNVPDLLIADLGMPELDGFELLTRIRASQEPLRNVTAIALSALVTDADRLRAIEVGFQAFISKPVTPKELVLTVLNLSRIRPATVLTSEAKRVS